MHQGQVVEHGDHHTLMAAGGRYAQLWRSQTEEAQPASVNRILSATLNGNGSLHTHTK
jgi:hypothetical protein